MLPALVFAVLAGAAVGAWRSAFAPEEYSATVIAEITPARPVLPGDAFVEQLRGPFMSLAQDSAVLDHVLGQVDVAWDERTLQQHISLAAGPSPAVMTITASADSPDRARQLAHAMLDALSQAATDAHDREISDQVNELQDAITAEETANQAMGDGDPAKAASDKHILDLKARLALVHAESPDRIAALSTPAEVPTLVSPRPALEGILTGVLAFVVAAESIALWRSRFGKRPNVTWAERVARRYGARLDTAESATSVLPAIPAAAVTACAHEGRRVLVLLGQNTDLDAEPFPDDLDGGGRTVVQAPLGDEWWHAVDVLEFDVALVIISVDSSDRSPAEHALRQLDQLGIPRYLILQCPSRRREASHAK
jgi:CheY-like chemotaxis protein